MAYLTLHSGSFLFLIFQSNLFVIQWCLQDLWFYLNKQFLYYLWLDHYLDLDLMFLNVLLSHLLCYYLRALFLFHDLISIQFSLTVFQIDVLFIELIDIVRNGWMCLIGFVMALKALIRGFVSLKYLSNYDSINSAIRAYE